MAAQDTQLGRDGEDQGLEIVEVVVARTTDVGGREEGEDILGGLWQFPELSGDLVLVGEDVIYAQMHAHKQETADG